MSNFSLQKPKVASRLVGYNDDEQTILETHNLQMLIDYIRKAKRTKRVAAKLEYIYLYMKAHIIHGMALRRSGELIGMADSSTKTDQNNLQAAYAAGFTKHQIRQSRLFCAMPLEHFREQLNIGVSLTKIAGIRRIDWEGTSPTWLNRGRDLYERLSMDCNVYGPENLQKLVDTYNLGVSTARKKEFRKMLNILQQGVITLENYILRYP